MVKRLPPTILIVVLMFLVLASPALAAVAQPDSLSIDTVFINRNLLETGDMLILAAYNIAYTVIPTVRADQAFVFRLIDTDESTQLASILPYVFNDNGYGQGMVSFYFAAADAPAFGVEYFIRISGNPAQFTSPPAENFKILASDYTSATTTLDNQAEVADNIRTIARGLEIAWSLTLLSEQDQGTVLSSTGESYFRNAVSGLQAMAPTVFFVQTLDIDLTERTWNTTQGSTYRDRLTGTWVDDSIDAAASVFRIDRQLMMGVVVVLLVVVAMWQSTARLNSTHPGFIASLLIMLFGVVQGWFSMVTFAIFGLFVIVYLGYWWFFQRA